MCKKTDQNLNGLACIMDILCRRSNNSKILKMRDSAIIPTILMEIKKYEFDNFLLISIKLIIQTFCITS